jgi:hypothetical protein
MQPLEEPLLPFSNDTPVDESVLPTTDNASFQEPMLPFNHAALMEEYRSCDDRVGRIDNLIWTMAAVVFPISLVGLSYFGINAQHTLEQLLIVTFVGFGSIALLLTWYFLSRQWHAYQKLAFYRMREIENEPRQRRAWEVSGD